MRGTLKATKHPKTILDEFRNLTPDDTEFLKALDKQFKLHGDKIKIEIKRENSTKNSKRTIDGLYLCRVLLDLLVFLVCNHLFI